MVKFHVMNVLTCFDYVPGDSGTREDIAQEIGIAQEIAEKPGLTQSARLQMWEDRTKLSRPTYYRRLQAGRANT